MLKSGAARLEYSRSSKKVVHQTITTKQLRTVTGPFQGLYIVSTFVTQWVEFRRNN